MRPNTSHTITRQLQNWEESQTYRDVRPYDENSLYPSPMKTKPFIIPTLPTQVSQVLFFKCLIQLNYFSLVELRCSYIS